MTLEAKPICIAVTPGSGEGRARMVARRLQRLLRRRGYAVAVQRFDDLPSLEQWAGECRPDFSLLICVGGDATQSAAAVLARRHRIPFVPVPNGFGNLFASVFGHPSAPAQVVRLLDEGRVQMVDVGMAGEELFLSHRSYGFLDQVQERVEEGRSQPRQRALRHLAYYWMAVRAIFTVPLDPLRVEVDGHVVAEDAVLATVANVETYRGFLSLTPKASPIDGKFDVFVVPRTSKLGLGYRLLKLKLASPRRWKGVALYRAQRVVVSAAGRTESLRLIRRALPLLLPPGALESLQRRQVEEAAVPVETLA